MSTFAFILVQPAVAENVGAAARAMNTMGFMDMRLVAPLCDHVGEGAKTLGHGSFHILQQARVYQTLQEALADCSFSVATTSSERHLRRNYISADHIADTLKPRYSEGEPLAIVFGREDSGLRNEEIIQCDAISSIPMAQMYPAVNLAQSVMVYAYLLSKLHDTPRAVFSYEQRERNEAEFRQLRVDADDALSRLGIGKSARSYARILEWLAKTSQNDMRLIYYLIRRIQTHVPKFKRENVVSSGTDTPPL